MRTSREACSGWGAVTLSFLGATLHVSTHAPSTCTRHPDLSPARGHEAAVSEGGWGTGRVSVRPGRPTPPRSVRARLEVGREASPRGGVMGGWGFRSFPLQPVRNRRHRHPMSTHTVTGLGGGRCVRPRSASRGVQRGDGQLVSWKLDHDARTHFYLGRYLAPFCLARILVAQPAR